MLGEALGAIGDTMSAPRRALMRALGLPEHGSELVHNLTGLDQDSFLTQALGFGADVATDPLTYLLPGAVGLAGKALRGAEAVSPMATLGENTLSRALASPETQQAVLAGFKGGAPLDALEGAAVAGRTARNAKLGDDVLGLGADLDHAAKARTPGPLWHFPEEAPFSRAAPGQVTDYLAQPRPTRHAFPDTIANPQEAEGHIGSLYNMLGDFEQDAAAGAIGHPEEVMRKRALLWEDILGAEAGYQEKLDAAAEHANNILGHDPSIVSPRDFMALGEHPLAAFAPGESLAPLERQFTHEQARAILQHQMNASAQADMARFLKGDPGRLEQLERFLNDHISGPQSGIQGPYRNLEDLSSRARDVLAEDFRDFYPQAQAALDEPWRGLATGLDQRPAPGALGHDRLPPGKEGELLALLQGKGYPVDMAKVYAWRRQHGYPIPKIDAMQTIQDVLQSFHPT